MAQWGATVLIDDLGPMCALGSEAERTAEQRRFSSPQEGKDTAAQCLNEPDQQGTRWKRPQNRNRAVTSRGLQRKDPQLEPTDNRCGHGTLASSDHGSHRPDPGIKDTGRLSVISRETDINSRLRPIQEL
ncbi:hypothetical protein LEMLEM_LOCUS2870 [Lemmus lemmus]